MKAIEKKNSFQDEVYRYMVQNFPHEAVTAYDLAHLYKGGAKPKSSTSAALSHLGRNGLIYKSESHKVGSKKPTKWKVSYPEKPTEGMESLSVKVTPEQGACNLAHVLEGIAGFNFWHYPTHNATRHGEWK